MAWGPGPERPVATLLFYFSSLEALASCADAFLSEGGG